MAFEAKVTGGEKCAACEGTGRYPRYAWIKSRDCPICKGHARYPMTVDIRGYKPPGSITNLPKGWDSTYDHILGDPPDNRSPMIQALDGKGWRESLVIADVLADETLWNDGRRPNVYGWTKGENPVRKREVDNLMRALPYLIDIPKVKCPVIRMLDDPAWRESLKVAETPVEAEYRALRDRLEAQRPAPSTWSSSRTGESLGWGGWGL